MLFAGLEEDAGNMDAVNVAHFDAGFARGGNEGDETHAENDYVG